ncbi:MAG: hypothetical protein DRO10_01710 [Thermoprotei archaeon]|nr:MAG: hypothetical protein DRO10_01710 [Thermoprotei archaeon]
MNVETLLRELIKIPSISGEEGEIASYLKTVLQEIGTDKAFIDSIGNVIGMVKGGGSGLLVVEGHMDTVDIGNPELWDVEPFSGKVIDGWVYGRGSSDMKGGITSQIKSIESIKELNYDIYLVYTVQEEIAEGFALREALQHVLPHYERTVVVTGEATELNLGLGHRGRAIIDVDFFGRSAHASMPEEGINALSAVGDYISRLKERAATFPQDPSLGKESATPIYVRCSPIGLPQLPDTCELRVDHRLLPSRNPEELKSIYGGICAEMERLGIIDECTPLIKEIRLTTWKGFILKGMNFFKGWVNREEMMIKKLLRELKKVYPYARRYYWMFSTDLVYPAGELGIPSLGLGPGTEAMAHKPNERVSISEVEKAAEEYQSLYGKLDRFF